MANAARQEIDITFDGKVYPVRPTFDVISSIESATGQSCSALAWKFFQSDPTAYASMTETCTVLFNALRPSIQSLNLSQVADIVMRDGMGPFWQPLGLLLSRALKGNAEHMRQAEEEAREAAVVGEKGPPQDGAEEQH